MKKSFKLFICALAVLIGQVAGQQQARAQWIISDPGNLVQSILQYIQDQMREGNFNLAEGLSKLEGMREQFKIAEEKWKQAEAVIQTVSKLWEAGTELSAIYRIGEMVYKDFQNFKELEYYFSCTMTSYQAVATIGNLIQLFSGITDEFISEVKANLFDLTKLTQGDALGILKELHHVTEYLYTGYVVIRQEFYDAFRRAYYADLNHRMHAGDALLIQRIFLMDDAHLPVNH